MNKYSCQIASGYYSLLLALFLSFALAPAQSSAEETTVKSAKTIQLAATRRARVKLKQPHWFKRRAASKSVQLLVSLKQQTVTLFENGKRIITSRVSSGRPGFSTPAGVYSILQKRRVHHSNIYSRAPMPYMQRLTWSGIALHAGNVSRRYASHGCIRLPYSFAQKLFQYTNLGAHVIITHNQSPFLPIAHKNLVAPAPIKEGEIKKTPAEKNLEHLIQQQQAAKEKLKQVSTALINVKNESVKKLRDYKNLKKSLRRNKQKLKWISNKLNWYEKHLKYTTRKAHKSKWHKRKHQRAIKARDNLNKKNIAVARKIQEAESSQIEIEIQNTEVQTKLQAAKENYNKAKKQLNLYNNQLIAVREAVRIEKLPLRILITRPNVAQYVKEFQQHLWELGYEPGEIDGYFGKDTSLAIRAFEIDNALPETGTLTIDLISKVRIKRSKAPLSDAHIYIRQNFTEIYNAPIKLIAPEKPLGTHFLTTLDFNENEKRLARWMALTLKSGRSGAAIPYKKIAAKKNIGLTNLPLSAATALDRITLPKTVRQWIKARLTPGSSLIIADDGSSQETGKGTDFIVQTR